ncbi:hypothetical protein SVIOM342S_09827 [Streptomyces violaceorubidus]
MRCRPSATSTSSTSSSPWASRSGTRRTARGSTSRTGRPASNGATSSPWRPTPASEGSSGAAAPPTSARASTSAPWPGWPGPSPGSRPMLAEWVAGVSRRCISPADWATSPSTSSPFETLNWLPGEILATAEQEVRDALGTGMAPVLARALRNGIVDELGWPAWDEAIGSSSVPPSGPAPTRVVEAWPQLVVLDGTHARVVGTQGTVLSHELRLPDDAGSPDVRYVDGGLLVSWYASATSTSYGYWYHPDTGVSPTTELVGDVRSSYVCHADGSGGTNGMPTPTLPLPGGGRTTGRGVLRPGDTHVPWRRRVISDGTSYWVWVEDWSREKNSAWHAYKPADDTVGERGGPHWLAEGLRAAPEGSTLGTCLAAARRLRRTGPGVRPGGRAARLAGDHPARRLAAGRGPGRRLGRRTVARRREPGERAGVPRHRPGRHRAADGRDNLQLRDSETAVLAHLNGDRDSRSLLRGHPPAAAPALLAPACRPRRDPQGSAALRRVDDDVAAALLGRGRGRDDRGRGGPGRGARARPHLVPGGRPRGAAPGHHRCGALRRRAAACPGRAARPAGLGGPGHHPGGTPARARRPPARLRAERRRPDRTRRARVLRLPARPLRAAATSSPGR